MNFPFLRFLVSGHSMEPRFHEGDRVIVRKKCTLQPKDVIVFRRKGITYLKRIITITPAGFFVKGDNETDSFVPFGSIARNEIIGKVMLKY